MDVCMAVTTALPFLCGAAVGGGLTGLLAMWLNYNQNKGDDDG